MHPVDRRLIGKILLRALASLTVGALVATSRFAPATKLTDGTRWALLAIAVAVGLGWVLTELLKLSLERLVGFRYLHRGRGSRWAWIGLAVGAGLIFVGFVGFAIAHPH